MRVLVCLCVCASGNFYSMHAHISISPQLVWHWQDKLKRDVMSNLISVGERQQEDEEEMEELMVLRIAQKDWESSKLQVLHWCCIGVALDCIGVACPPVSLC